MKYKIILGLILFSLIFEAQTLAQSMVEYDSRDLYTYSFGGLEKLPVDEVVDMLNRLGYSGIAAEARGSDALERLEKFHEWSAEKGDDFKLMVAFMAHRFDKYGFDDSAHKAAIDRLAGKEGYLQLWVRDKINDGSITDAMVEDFIRGIVDYAISKEVKVILYPHSGTWYETTEEVMELANKIDHPLVGVAINLCHELRADKGSVEDLTETFEMAKGRIFSVLISGSLIDIDKKDVNTSTVRPLDDSPYDLKPYMRLIQKSGFNGPVGFMNFKLKNPEDYLGRTMTVWKELCKEVGLYDYGASSSYFDECDVTTDWNSSADLGLNTNDNHQGEACLEFVGSTTDEYKKVFFTPFDSKGSTDKTALRFMYYVSDASLLGTNNQVELGSAGVADQDEYSWKLSGLKTGWNFVTLKLSNANVIGTPNLNAINWFRLYNEKSGAVTTRIDLIQIINVETMN